MPAAPPRRSFTPWIARVCATLIDLLPLLVGAAISQGVSLSTAGVDCVTYPNGGVACTGTPSAAGTLTATVVALASVLYVVLNFGRRQGRTGSSLGKSVMRFRVVGVRDGRPVGFWVSLLRLALHTVDALVCFLGFLWPLWDARRQTFADKIVATVCVRVPRDEGGVSGRR